MKVETQPDHDPISTVEQASPELVGAAVGQRFGLGGDPGQAGPWGQSSCSWQGVSSSWAVPSVIAKVGTREENRPQLYTAGKRRGSNRARGGRYPRRPSAPQH